MSANQVEIKAKQNKCCIQINNEQIEMNEVITKQWTDQYT